MWSFRFLPLVTPLPTARSGHSMEDIPDLYNLHQSTDSLKITVTGSVIIVKIGLS